MPPWLFLMEQFLSPLRESEFYPLGDDKQSTERRRCRGLIYTSPCPSRVSLHRRPDRMGRASRYWTWNKAFHAAQNLVHSGTRAGVEGLR